VKILVEVDFGEGLPNSLEIKMGGKNLGGG
jgi:hypothetical protein